MVQQDLIIGNSFDNNYKKREKLIENSKDKIVTKYSATLEEILDYIKLRKLLIT